MEPENQPQEKEIFWNHHFLGFHATLWGCSPDTDPRKDSESFYLVEPHIPRLLAVHVALQGQISAVTVGETQELRWNSESCAEKTLGKVGFFRRWKNYNKPLFLLYKDPH